jgi:hypothetical protein
MFGNDAINRRQSLPKGSTVRSLVHGAEQDDSFDLGNTMPWDGKILGQHPGSRIGRKFCPDLRSNSPETSADMIVDYRGSEQRKFQDMSVWKYEVMIHASSPFVWITSALTAKIWVIDHESRYWNWKLRRLEIYPRWSELHGRGGSLSELRRSGPIVFWERRDRLHEMIYNTKYVLKSKPSVVSDVSTCLVGRNWQSCSLRTAVKIELSVGPWPASPSPCIMTEWVMFGWSINCRTLFYAVFCVYLQDRLVFVAILPAIFPSVSIRNERLMNVRISLPCDFLIRILSPRSGYLRPLNILFSIGDIRVFSVLYRHQPTS